MKNEKITTIGITSFNRLKYFRALIKSLESLPRESYEIIVVDNCSTESGLQDYIAVLEKENKIDKAVIRKPENRNWINDEYVAKNLIIQNASCNSILFLQDDLQFVGTHEILSTIVREFSVLPFPCLEMNGIRRCSNEGRYRSNRGFSTDSGNKYWASDDNHFQTMGLFDTRIFANLGDYPVDWPLEKEYWGRSEDFYDALVKKNFPNKQINISCHVPLFLPVWNESRGGYAFIRGDRRYGEYNDPVDSSGLYYEKLTEQKYRMLLEEDKACSFVDVASPLGWQYKKTEDGDQYKYSQRDIVLSEEGVPF